MFCPNCGTQQTDGALNCTSCGCSLQEEQQTNYQPAPAQPQYAPEYVPAPPQFSKFDKNAGKFVYITFFLSLALLVGSVLIPLTGNIFNVPSIKILANIAANEVDINESKNEINDSIDELEEQYEKFEDELSSEEQEIAEQIVDAGKNIRSKWSFLSLRNFISITVDAGNKIDVEEWDLEDDLNELKTFETIINIIMWAIIGAFFFPLLFTLLGGLLKSKVMTLLALIFLVIAQLLLCGVLWVALSLVIYIFQFILCSKAKKVKKTKKMHGMV